MSHSQAVKRPLERTNLKEQQKIVEIMKLPENCHANGNPNFYKLSKPINEGGLGIDRCKLRRWWAKRDQITDCPRKSKRFRVEFSTGRAVFPEMERELAAWIESKRSEGCCIGGFVIRVKAMEIMQEKCERNNIPCNFKASIGWLLNFLRRNKFVLRRITTTGRDLPENSIDTILKFLIDMRKLFIDIEDFDLDSLINMDETSIYLDFPSNYTYEKKVLNFYFNNKSTVKN
jgi:hypothetical protein